MDTRSVVRKPIIAAVLGALVVALPMTIVYYAEVRPAAAAAAAPAVTTTAPLIDPPAQGTPASLVPASSAMVRQYGPAVVKISVVATPPGASFSTLSLPKPRAGRSKPRAIRPSSNG